MILVTLGTQKQDFSRLLQYIEDSKIKDEIIVQAGYTKFKSEKMKMLLEKNPTMTNEEISDFWKRIAGTINFPEKLEIMGENPKKYKGIEQLRAMFMSLRQTAMENRKKTIQITEIEDATREIRVFDINNETNNIRTKIQDDKDYNRGD